jgi:hypothetical protein
VPPICTSRCRARQARSGVSDPKAALESYTCRILGFPSLLMRVRPGPTKLRKWVLGSSGSFRDHRGRLVARCYRSSCRPPTSLPPREFYQIDGSRR